MEKRVKMPVTFFSRLIPGPIVKLLGPLIWVRPMITEKCVACGRCVEACPVKALSMISTEQKPVLKGKQCIGCCCCHEICPEKAIAMTQSPLLNIVRKGKML